MVTDSGNGVVSYRQFRLHVSALNLVDGRYPGPGTLTNATGHAERVEHDQRWAYDTATNGKGLLHKRCQGRPAAAPSGGSPSAASRRRCRTPPPATSGCARRG